MFKKLFVLVVLALALYGGQSAWAVSSITFTGKDSTVNAIRVRATLTADAPDSAATAWYLYYSLTDPPLTLGASMTSGISAALDTSTYISSLYNGTQYYVQIKAIFQDTTTGARTTHIIWSGVDSIITKTIGQTIAVITDSAAVDKTYRNFRVSDVWFSDSTLVTLGMQYRVSGATDWTWAAVAAHYGNAVGRDSVQLASPDTLCALSNGLTIDLLPGRTYQVRVIGYYGTAAAQAFRGSDTSNTLTVTVATVPGASPSYNLTEGEVAPGLWHFRTTYDNLNETWNSPHFFLNSGYKAFIVEAQKFGWDDNHPADSSKLYLMQANHVNDVGYAKLDSALFNGLSGGLATAATGVMCAPDTASGRKLYGLSVSEVRTVARAANDTTFINAWNSELWFYHVPKDSAGDFGASTDTTTLDPIYVDIWVQGRK